MKQARRNDEDRFQQEGSMADGYDRFENDNSGGGVDMGSNDDSGGWSDT